MDIARQEKDSKSPNMEQKAIEIHQYASESKEAYFISIPDHNNSMEEDGFILVGPKQRHQPTPTPVEQLSRVQLCRFRSCKELESYPILFKAIFDAPVRINLQAAIVPFNQDPAWAIGLPLLLRTTEDYKAMMDITLMNWGKPSEHRGKLALSFYIASTVTTPDLTHLKQSCHFQDVIKTSKFTIFQHNLLQTDPKALAFFSGKSPDHTWQGDLSNRFQFDLENFLQDDHDIKNIFGEEYHGKIPKAIPFYLKPRMVKSKTIVAQAVALY